MEPLRWALTYDDVLLEPRHSSVRSRRDVDTSTFFTKNIPLSIPIVSANMDTVTEAEMCIALAELGGIGVLHRFMPWQRQVEEVRKVKRRQGLVVEEPYTIGSEATIGEARALSSRLKVSGFLVAGADGKLLGIVTRRDTRFAGDGDLVSAHMTPRERLVTGPAKIGLAEAQALLERHRPEKLPLVDEQGRIAGLITAKDLERNRSLSHASRDGKGRLRVAAAVGVTGDYFQRAAALAEAGADALVVDIAHGDSDVMVAAISALKRALPRLDLVAGNVATASGVAVLYEAGADAVKIGIGPGSICTTRQVAGVGVPQLTAVLESAEEAERPGVPAIADGGIRFSDDIAKALAAGAASVMIGNLLAGTDESPGLVLMERGRKVKVARGMASAEAAVDRAYREDPALGWAASESDLAEVAPEGIQATVPYRGPVGDVVRQLVGGLRSGMSYSDTRTLPELRANARFVRITEAGRVESGPHDVLF